MTRTLAALLGLLPLTKNRRGARWGFPLRLLDSYLARLRKAGRSLVLVTERATWEPSKSAGRSGGRLSRLINHASWQRGRYYPIFFPTVNAIPKSGPTLWSPLT